MPELGRSPASSTHLHLPAARPGWQCASSPSFLNQGNDRVPYLRSQQQEGARRWAKRTSHAFDHSARGLVSAKVESSTRTMTTSVCVHGVLPLPRTVPGIKQLFGKYLLNE